MTEGGMGGGRGNGSGGGCRRKPRGNEEMGEKIKEEVKEKRGGEWKININHHRGVTDGSMGRGSERQ